MKAIAAGMASLLAIPIFVLAALGDAFAESEAQAAFEAEGAGGATPAPDGPGGGPAGAAPVSPDGDLRSKVLSHPRIRLSAGARMDVDKGRADERILKILLILAERHDLGYVGPIATGHSYFVKGSSKVSNHVYGRAVDISVVDGRRADASNEKAYEAAATVAHLDPPLRPDELGGPWRIQAKGVYSFSDASHKSHIHIGFDR